MNLQTVNTDFIGTSYCFIYQIENSLPDHRFLNESKSKTEKKNKLYIKTILQNLSFSNY